MDPIAQLCFPHRNDAWPYQRSMSELGLIAYSLLSLMNILIAVYVYVRDPARSVNRAFAALGTTAALWAFFTGLAHNAATSTLRSVQATFSFAAILPAALLTFCLIFPSSPFPRTWWYGTATIPAVIFAVIAHSSLLVKETVYTANGLSVSYGPLHWAFGIYFSLCLGGSLLILWRKVRTATGLERLQLWYVILGLVVPALAGAVTNLFVPLLLGTSRLGRYGPAFTAVFLALTAHAIIRHRLMNLRLVISRSVAYIIAVAFSCVAFAGILTFISPPFISSSYREQSFWLSLLVLFVIVPAFQPLKAFIQSALDRYLYRHHYDYEQTVRDATRTIATTLDLSSLLEYLCTIIGTTLRPERISVYIRSSEVQEFTLIKETHPVQSQRLAAVERVAADSPVATLLSRTKTHLLTDDLLHRRDIDQPSAVLADITTLDAACAVPIVEDEHLLGFILLGKKLSGDPYFTEDLDLLTTLIGQAAIAIKNADLYRHAVVVNEYIETILATMESAVVAANSHGVVTLFNAAAERLTHLKSNEVKNLPIQKLPVALGSLLDATLNDGCGRSGLEVTYESFAAGSQTLLCSTSVLKDHAGTILGAMVVSSDITRLKQLERETQCAERLASIGALASGIAHEIKNPLVAIRTFAELLPERFADEDFRENFSRVVIQEIGRIDGLVARLRGIAAHPARSSALLDVRVPLDETLALLRAQFEQQRISVHITYPETVPRIEGDLAQLKQLFLNVFMNGLEAIGASGSLSVTVRSAGTGGVSVEISDSGTGIRNDLLEKIFDPFVTTKEQGSGLGLSICRGIADAHRAKLYARNNVNNTGATVIVEFPVASGSSSANSSDWYDERPPASIRPSDKL